MDDKMIMLTFDEDGKAEIYDDEFDITIHCTSQESYDETLKILRSANWIPCSERLPEDRRTVLVTAYRHETYQVMMASYFGDGLWWCIPFNNFGEYLKPKAWMPLPEPWKGEKDKSARI